MSVAVACRYTQQSTCPALNLVMSAQRYARSTTKRWRRRRLPLRVSQSHASRPSRAAAPLQRNGPRWPSTRLGVLDQDVIQSFRVIVVINRPTDPPTNRQGRLQYTAPQLARSVIIAIKLLNCALPTAREMSITGTTRKYVPFQVCTPRLVFMKCFGGCLPKK